MATTEIRQDGAEAAPAARTPRGAAALSKINPSYLLAAAIAIGWAFVGANYWIFTVTSGIILGIAGLGLLVVVGWGREISLVQAGLTGTAAYLTGYFYRSIEGGWGLPYLVAVALAVATVVLMSVVIALGTAKLSGIYIMVLTLGLQFMIERTIFTEPQLTGGITAFKTPRPELLGIGLQSDKVFYFFTLGVAAMLIAVLIRVRRSSFGRAFLFAGWDRHAAAATGISPWRYKILAFAIAGVFAGIAGALVAPLFRSPPLPLTFGAFYSLMYLSIPVVAGFESFVSVIAVGVLFAVVPQALESWHISPFILAGLGLLAGTLAGPRGVSGAAAETLKYVKNKRFGSKEIVLGDDRRDSQGRREAIEILEDYMPQRGETGDILVGRNIALAFGGVKALDGVDVTVPARKFVGLIGPNGAGKSTLFDVLNGLKTPDSGEVFLFGQDVTNKPAWDRAKLGMSRTFQSNRINPELSVGENLLIGATKQMGAGFVSAVFSPPKARAAEKRAQRAGRAVAYLLDIDQWWEERAGNLDFGAQRRVEIGRSMLTSPQLLLLDEPAAGLDAHESADLFELIRQLQADLGLTVLLVEHYVKAVLENADIVYVLHQGKLLAAGTPAEIAAHPRVRSEYLGSGDYLPADHTEERV